MNVATDPTLAAALVAAQRAISNVPHDKTNTFHRYSYTSSEAIFREAREALLGAGLAAVMTGWSIESEEAVRVSFRLIHESGASTDYEVVAPALVDKGRPFDKAVSAALTLAESYWLRGLLLIPRVADSEDVAGRDDTAYTPVAKPASRPAPRPAPRKRPVSEAQLRELTVATRKYGVTREAVLEHCRESFQAASPRDLSEADFCSLLAWVRLEHPETPEPEEEGELLGQPPFPNSSSPIHDCRALSHDRAHDQQEQETKR